MKRDMDLVRTILLEAEGAEPGQSVVGVDGYDDITFAYHVEMMVEANLVEAAVARASGVGPVKAHVNRLTWDGHDFLDAVRNDSIWSKTKAHVAGGLGSASFEVLKAVAVSLAIKAATQGL